MLNPNFPPLFAEPGSQCVAHLLGPGLPWCSCGHQRKSLQFPPHSRKLWIKCELECKWNSVKLGQVHLFLETSLWMLWASRKNNDSCGFYSGHTLHRFVFLKSHQHRPLQGDLKLETLRKVRLKNKDYVMVNFMCPFYVAMVPSCLGKH